MKQSVLVLSDLVPEDEDFVSLPDALFYQMKEQNHFCRVLQDAGVVVRHDFLCLVAEKTLTFLCKISLFGLLAKGLFQ